MLDRRHAGTDRRLDSVGAVGMGRHPEAVARRFFHHRAHLGLGKLLRTDRRVEGQDARGRADLDDPGSVFGLLAHRLDHLVHAVGHAVQRVLHHDTGGEAGHVAVAAGNTDRVTGGDDPGAVDVAPIDGAHERHVGKVACPDVPHRGEAGQQRLSCIHHPVQRLVRRGFPDRRQLEPGADLAGQMDVGIDQSGQQRGLAQIDDGRAGGRGPADLHDTVSLDHHHGIVDDSPGSHVEHTGRAHHHRRGSLHRGRLAGHRAGETRRKRGAPE